MKGACFSGRRRRFMRAPPPRERPMKLYFHPVSSYSQKALVAFYEKGCAFEPVIINLMDPKEREAYQKINPIVKIPFLRVEEKNLELAESSIIIEYIDR